jgi:putative ABC transport system permease protein
MEFKEYFLSAYQSLKSSKMRTSLTMLGIIIGISAVILIVSIGQGAVQYITDELSAFGTNFFSINPGSTPVSAMAGGKKTLTLDDMEAIQQDQSISNIENVIPFAAASVTVSANGVDKTVLVYGTTDEAVKMLNSEIMFGEFLSEDDIHVSSRVVVAGAEAITDFFGEGTDPVDEIIRIDNKPFRIIGVSKAGSGFFGGFFDKAMFIPIDVSINQILGQNAGLQEIDISVYDTNLINQTIEDVSLLLRDRHNIDEDQEDDFLVQSFQDALTTVQTITGLLTAVVAAISGISLVVGGVGVMNIMLVTVTERTREIGLLKAIGAKQRDILRQFLMEAVVLTLGGGIIGILLGIGGAYLVSLFAPIPFVISIPAVIIAVVVSISVGIIFGIYPARRAARLSPIDALRHE